MNPFEQLKIEKLPGQNNEKGLNQGQLKDYFDDRFFDDLKNQKIKIKQQGDLYIFEQEDINSSKISESGKFINKFYVEKKILQQYLKEEQKKEEISSISDELLGKFFLKIQTKHELDSFGDEIVNTQKDVVSEDLDGKNIDGENIDKLIDDYSKYLKYSNKDLKNTRDGRETLRELQKEAEYRIKTLNRIKGDISNRIDKSIYLRDIDLCENELPDFETAIQKAIVGERGNVPRLLHGKKSIKKYDRELEKQNNFALKINKVLKEVAANKLFLDDQEGLRDYLEAVYHGEIDAKDHPFYAKNQGAFLQIQITNPALYSELTPKVTTSSENNNNHTINYNNNKGVDKGGSLFSDALVKIGMIDENDKTKQEAWAKFSKVGILALGAFAIYKIFTSKGGERWGWIGGLVGGALALKNPDKIKSWFKDAFGSSNPDIPTVAAGTNTSMDTMNQYIKPQASTIKCIGGIPLKTLVSQKLVEEKGGKMEMNYVNYENYINEMTVSAQEKKYYLDEMNIIKNDKDKNLLDNALSTMNINSLDDLTKLAKDDNTTLIDTDNALDYFERLQSPVNAELEKEGLEAKDAKSWYEMTKNYDKSKSIEEQINQWILAGYLQMKNNFNNNTIEDMKNNPDINLSKKTLVDFKDSTNNEIKFGTYMELFKAADLTKFVKGVFKDKPAKSASPFHEEMFGIGNIQFDNQNWYEVWKNETDVVNANPFKNTLKDTSQTLNSNSGYYVAYLNRRWNIEGKVVS